VVYTLCFLLFLVGLFGAMTQKNLIKIVISIAIIESAVNMFLILVSYRTGGIAPIADSAHQGARFAAASVDPLPHAMVLTAIVIGLGVLALLVAISLRLYHCCGTYDITEIRKLRG